MNDVQPTKNKIFTFKDLDIEATPTQKIAFNLNYLHRFREEGGHFYPIKFVNGVSLDFGSIVIGCEMCEYRYNWRLF